MSLPYRGHVNKFGEPKKKYTVEEAYLIINRDGYDMTPYECDLCGWWHLGSNDV